jgi:hypothetical protein
MSPGVWFPVGIFGLAHTACSEESAKPVMHRRRQAVVHWNRGKVALFEQRDGNKKMKINCGLKNKNVVYSLRRDIHFVTQAGG